MIKHELRSGVIWEGDWLEAPLEGGYTMSEVDGPFGMGKAKWDMMKIEGLAAWYRPHLTRLTSLMALSSSVYLWNTAEGWARIDPVMRELEWTFRSLIVWDKVLNPAVLGWRGMTAWGDSTEVCGFYVRGSPHFNSTPEAADNVWTFDVSNELRKERIYDGTAMDRNGNYVSRDSLHPCQKPLLFAERMVQASTRPGDRICVPFGGTARIAVYLEHLARTEPDQARYFDSCELNQDPGKDYIGPVLAQMRGEGVKKPGQMSLF